MQREKLVFFYGSTDSSKCIRDLIASAKGSQASVESPDQSQSEVKSKHSSTVYTSLGMLRSDFIKVDGEGGNAYHVFGDATLKVLSKRIPRTKEELLEIRGIGKGILAKYGD